MNQYLVYTPAMNLGYVDSSSSKIVNNDMRRNITFFNIP